MKAVTLSKIVTNIKSNKKSKLVNKAGKIAKKPIANRSLKFNKILPDIINAFAESNLNQPTYVYEVKINYFFKKIFRMKIFNISSFLKRRNFRNVF